MKNVVVEACQLNSMPYDRWDAESHRHIHATGYAVRFSDGHWQTEYSDDDFEYSPDCIYTYEEDDE